MRSGRSDFYRGRNGEERLWLSAADIEATMEASLHKAAVFPTEAQPAVNIERFIQELGVGIDQHAELEGTVLGQTEFYDDGPPKIFINRDLSDAVDDDKTPPGIRGRWRATFAHETGHVLLHRVLFEVNRDQKKLFNLETQRKPRSLMRCLKKNVLFRGEGTDWREVQANMAMAALLMPQSLFRRLAGRVVAQTGLRAQELTAGSTSAITLGLRMAELFDVSRQAASIRLETLGIVSPAGQPWLMHEAS